MLPWHTIDTIGKGEQNDPSIYADALQEPQAKGVGKQLVKAGNHLQPRLLYGPIDLLKENNRTVKAIMNVRLYVIVEYTWGVVGVRVQIKGFAV